MHKIAKQSMILFTIAALIFAPMVSHAADNVDVIEDDPSAGAMLGDLVLIRPLALASTVLGTALFFVVLPFSALGGNVKQSGKKLIVDPFKMTFVRPIGQF